MLKPLDVSRWRREFPALSRQVQGQPAAFLDGPAGTQVPQRVADAVSRYLTTCNANHGGAFATSEESDALLDQAHLALADFLGSSDPETISFGANMTSLTFAISRALARTWKPGDEVVVTRLDHDANVTPWVLAARDAGAVIRRVELNPRDLTLDLDSLREQLSPRTRLVAVGCASNATGGINPVAEISEMAHAAGALVFADAVHYAPHGLLDVAALGADILVCSAYKFFGPHVGIQWGRRELLESLEAYKVRPAPNELPGKWMTGTQNHEGIAGALEAVNYLADLGRECDASASDRRAALRAAFAAITAHEQALSCRLLDGLAALEPIQVWGISDPARVAERCPTFSITHRHVSPAEVARRCGERGIFVWHGNYYALSLSEALNREPEGMVRIGLVHYNTADEVERLLNVLAELGASESP